MSSFKPWPKRPQNYWNLSPYATWSTDERLVTAEPRTSKVSCPSTPEKRSRPSNKSPVYQERIWNRQRGRRYRLQLIAKRMATLSNMVHYLMDLEDGQTFMSSTSSSSQEPPNKKSRINSPASLYAIETQSSPSSPIIKKSEIGNATSRFCGEELEQAKRARYSKLTQTQRSTSTQESPGSTDMKDNQ